MTIIDLIERKRDGFSHSPEEFSFIAEQAANPHPKVTDAQFAAWLMAVVWRGMNPEELAQFTLALAHSGQTLSLEPLPKPWFDKHSTGGVGDKTTLSLLPMLAATGLTVVKMSGRGLGITGGTTDKLSSIAGFQTELSLDQMKSQAQAIGLALTGQTPKLTPADKKLYALRDVTGTVPSIPLIASSVLSKKIAGGADHILIDLKVGSGAFMQTLEQGALLAQAMRDIAQGLGLKLRVVVSDMNRPLGRAIGNRLEVIEAMQTLVGGATGDFPDFCLDACGHALHLAGLAPTPEAGRTAALAELNSGQALAKAEAWLLAQEATETPQSIAQSSVQATPHVFPAPHSGWVSHLDARGLGMAAMRLGAGRQTADDTIDLQVGIWINAQVGDPVQTGQPILTVYGDPSDEVRRLIEDAIVVSATEPSPQTRILRVL